jgi:hypothetical protein
MNEVHSSEIQTCIENCTRCHETCLRMLATHCLHLAGRHVEPEHMRLMLDCSQICQTAADFMTRGSPRHAAVCDVCAEICAACATDCERIGDMDECVEVCRTCADSCRRMAEME